MSWTNHGHGHRGRGIREWHIDHIRPCATFNFNIEGYNMGVKSTNLKITRGDTKSYLLHFTDENTVDKNITGWTIFFTVTCDLEATTDTNAKITKTITTHTDPTHGKSTINLTSTDTNLVGDYYYDVQIKYDGKIETILMGVITFNADASKRTT